LRGLSPYSKQQKFLEALKTTEWSKTWKTATYFKTGGSFEVFANLELWKAVLMGALICLKFIYGFEVKRRGGVKRPK